MPRFAGTESRVFTIRAPFDKVVGTMTEPDKFRAYFLDLVRFEKVNDTTWRWVLEEKNEKGVRFQGDYTVKYSWDGKRELTWETVNPGNMTSVGRATFVKEGETATRVDYTETIECDMDVNRILAVVIKPIVNREIAKGVGGYLDAVKAGIEK